LFAELDAGFCEFEGVLLLFRIRRGDGLVGETYCGSGLDCACEASCRQTYCPRRILVLGCVRLGVAIKYRLGMLTWLMSPAGPSLDSSDAAERLGLYEY